MSGHVLDVARREYEQERSARARRETEPPISIDLRKLVEAAGPLARLTLETDEQGEPRVVELAPLPRHVEEAVEACVDAQAPVRSPEEQRCMDIEDACVALVGAIRTVEARKARVDMGLKLGVFTEDQADGLVLGLEGEEEQALLKARADIRTLLGLPQ